MEINKEIITLSKIRDGLFIGDNRSGTNLDLLMQFKISHIINATGIPLPYSFESIGIKYLTINWLENPPDDTIIIEDGLIPKIISKYPVNIGRIFRHVALTGATNNKSRIDILSIFR